MHSNPSPLLTDCRYLFSTLHEPLLKHACLLVLAKYETTLVDTKMLLLDSPPPFVLDVYQADLQGIATKRLVNASLLYPTTTTVTSPQAMTSVRHSFNPLMDNTSMDPNGTLTVVLCSNNVTMAHGRPTATTSLYLFFLFSYLT